jgi:hypothetical protein
MIRAAHTCVFFPSLLKTSPGDYLCIHHPVKSEGMNRNAQERAAIEEFDAATAAYKKNLQHAAADVRIVDLPGANHYSFLRNEQDVMRELQVFVAGLHYLFV